MQWESLEFLSQYGPEDVFGEEGLVYRKACFEASFKQTFRPSSLRFQPCSTDKKLQAVLAERLGILVSKLSPCQQSKQIAIHSHHPDQGLHIVAHICVVSVLKWIFCKNVTLAIFDSA